MYFFYSVHGLPLSVLPPRYLKWIRLFIWRDNIKLLFFFSLKIKIHNNVYNIIRNKDNKIKDIR